MINSCANCAHMRAQSKRRNKVHCSKFNRATYKSFWCTDHTIVVRPYDKVMSEYNDEIERLTS